MYRKIVGILISMLIICTIISSGFSYNVQISNLKNKYNTEFLSNPPSEEWNKTYGGALFDNGYGVMQTSDGGYILGSSKDETGYYQGGDCWLIKTDPDGNVEWNKTFGGLENDKGWIVKQTIDGGYAIIGVTNSFSHPSHHDIYFVKTDSFGNKLWEKTYGGSGADAALYFQETADGGFIIVGTWMAYSICDVWLIKTDSNGNMLWNKTFGGANIEYGYFVQQTNDLGYIIISGTSSYGSGDFDAWLIKTDSNGILQWEKTFGGVGIDVGYSLILVNDGSYIITGLTCSYGDSNGDVWLIKTDSNGNEQWNLTYGGNGYDYGYFIEKTKEGGFIILGGTESFSVGDEDFYLIKTDFQGNKLWDTTFGGINRDNGKNVWQTDDGGYILSGLTYSYGAGESDMWLIKLAPENNENINIEINGGFGLSASVTNNGEAPINNLTWSIDVEPSIGLILSGSHTDGIINLLGAGDSQTIQASNLRGIGLITITIQVSDAEKQATAFLLGPLVLRVTEI